MINAINLINVDFNYFFFPLFLIIFCFIKECAKYVICKKNRLFNLIDRD